MKMKIQILILFFLALAVYALPKEKPTPLKETEFQFPDFDIKGLDNGIRVYLLKDDEQPLINISLILKSGSAHEDKVGTTDLLSELLTKGADKKTALEIAEFLDGTGSYLNVNVNKDYILIQAGGLKKNLTQILDLLSDVITKPTLDKKEFEKIKTRLESSLELEKNDSWQLAKKLSSKIAFGDTHPYAQSLNQENLAKLELEDIKTYWQDYFKANNASIAVSGDLEDNIIDKLEKALGKWQKGAKKAKEIPTISPNPAGIYYINRPGSVQSSVYSFANIIGATSIDYEKAVFLQNLEGGGFSSRLFKSLRETYAYCYTPFATATKFKNANKFLMGADVRTDVTDSTLDYLIKEVETISKSPFTDLEVEETKQIILGSYYMGFESSDYIATKILTGEIFGVTPENIKSYPDRVKSYNSSEIIGFTSSIFTPMNRFYVVIGDEDARKKIERFGKISEYDLDLNPNLMAEKVNLSYSEITDKYMEAIGGKGLLNSVKSLSTNSTVDLIDGANTMNVSATEYRTNDKYYLLFDMGFQKSKTIFNSKTAYSVMNDIVDSSYTDINQMKFLSAIFREVKLNELGFEVKVVGKKAGQIIVNAKANNGTTHDFFFDEKSFLLTKLESLEVNQLGKVFSTTYFTDYSKFDNVLLPKTVKVVNNFYKANFTQSYKVNEVIQESIFQP
jgi:predicted Zn-dependent peptidase